MDWVRHAIWWQVYPLGFVGADTTGANRQPAHRLTRLVDFLDHAVRLGASGIALGPIFESASHGYDTIDHFRIDSRLGDDADFDHLIEQARRRGLRVLLDGVFNHVGADFPAYAEVRLEGAAAARADWFVPAGGDSYATFEGHPGLITLNHANPAVADYVVGVMEHWLDRGADGWRLDAAYAVPTAFWAEVLPRVRATYPEAYLVGEVIHGDYAQIVAESGMDAVTQYELWKAIWGSLNDRNLFELAWALERHNGWLDSFAPMTFVGNHDVTRLASRLDDVAHIGHALALLLTVGGTPSLYYGDEVAMTGVKEDRVGGDDAVRPAYPAHPEQLPEAGWSTFRLHQDLVGTRRRHPWLHAARTTVVHLANEQLIYDTAAEGESLRVLLNVGATGLVHPVHGAELVAGNASVSDDKVVVPSADWAIVRC